MTHMCAVYNANLTDSGSQVGGPGYQHRTQCNSTQHSGYTPKVPDKWCVAHGAFGWWQGYGNQFEGWRQRHTFGDKFVWCHEYGSGCGSWKQDRTLNSEAGWRRSVSVDAKVTRDDYHGVELQQKHDMGRHEAEREEYLGSGSHSIRNEGTRGSDHCIQLSGDLPSKSKDEREQYINNRGDGGPISTVHVQANKGPCVELKISLVSQLRLVVAWRPMGD